MRLWVRIALVILAVLLAGAIGLGWWFVRWSQDYLAQPPQPQSPAGLMTGLDALAPGMGAAEAATILTGLGANTRLFFESNTVGDKIMEARFRDGRLTYVVAGQKVGEVQAHFDPPAGNTGSCRQAARDLAKSFEARLGPPQRTMHDDAHLFRYWRQEKDWLFLTDHSAQRKGGRTFCAITAGRLSDADASNCQQHCHGK